ncbi:MAG: isochorismatase family protein [Blastochloris sp.]|nr:isochorismatase family protein [Blastochloris sp.]
MSWRIEAEQVELLVVDAQEKLLPAMHQAEILEKKLGQLIEACVILGVPVSFSEQYPKGLGRTLTSLKKLAPGAPTHEKTRFSAGEFGNKLERKKILVAGVETHICLRQTVYDLSRQGKTVIVVADATSSRCVQNKELALSEFVADKIFITSVEALLFEFLQDAEHPKFKEISNLIK